MITEVQSIKKKLEQLHKLLDAASSEAKKWGEARGYDTDYCSEDERYLEYREDCFDKIYDTYWKIARQIGISMDDYDSYDTKEEIMRGYLQEFEDSCMPSWLLDVLEEIEEE